MRSRARDTEHHLFDRASDRVAEQLRQLILSLSLAPGSLIVESEISEKLGCGRTPLREALLRLHQENLVVALPRRAISVADISIFDLQQTYEARSHLEAAMARLAAERIGESALDEAGRLLQHLEALSPDASPVEITEADMAFHRWVAKAAGNHYLLDAFDCVEGPACRLSVVAYQRGPYLPTTIREHRAILEALRRHDPDAAAARTAEHIGNAKERILRVL